MTQPDDDRVDPRNPEFVEAVTAIASTYFTEAAVQTRKDVARELENAGWESAAHWLRKRTAEIDAGLPGRTRRDRT